ncbi:MAG: Na(+)-translocating NADH-quinone reductase subunit A [Bacteroidales bacterium]|jgi:Na+-transporting NADH:ubiquinone oxidoreductase subunit A|nr:Na(+)-translocating NADH-quinone reductase subunit A [Bacteroidales bacterium]
MLNLIKIRKGLDVPIGGQAEPKLRQIDTVCCALKPQDFIGVTPKLLVDEGDKVKVGTPVFFAKEKPEIKFVSPISGQIKSIVRGEKRVIEAIIIEADGKNDYEDFGCLSVGAASYEQVRDKMLEGGVWTLLRQRPYSVIPKPDTKPKCIVIKGFDSAPLSPDYSVLLKGEMAALQVGIDALSKLTDGKVHLNIHQSSLSEELLHCENVQRNTFAGKHPCGNVSVQIERLYPINKGERVWYIDATDVVTIGKLFLEGHYVSDKIVALTGSEVKSTGYYKIKRGACLKPLFENNVTSGCNLRYISGNVLTGTQIAEDGFLSAYDSQTTVIKEGDNYEFLGWVMPGFKKFSFSRTFPYSFLKCFCKKPVKIDANLHGGHRAFVFNGEFEKVLPLNIYPLQLIKACIVEDIDQMEQLGIYEVDSEDFALCEVIDVSKTEIQKIIRNGLELMRKEMGE